MNEMKADKNSLKKCELHECPNRKKCSVLIKYPERCDYYFFYKREQKDKSLGGGFQKRKALENRLLFLM